MRTKNTVSLIGVAGKDAELKIVNGVPYARFSIATSTGGYQKQDGTQVPEKTQWHSIVVWRNLAEVVGKWVKKGMKVAVDGMITYGEYTNSQGQKIYTTDILASDIVLMSAPQEQQTTQQTQQPMQNAPQPQQPIQTQQQVQPQSQPQGAYYAEYQQQQTQNAQQPMQQNMYQQQAPFQTSNMNNDVPF